MSTQRRVFPETFKREAVDRVASSGQSASAVAVWDQIKARGNLGALDARKNLPKSAAQKARFCA